jgi:hypothetical protein
MKNLKKNVEKQKKKIMVDIYFYSKDKPFFEFSNYFISNFTLNIGGNEYTYNCVEVYYQAQKFYNRDDDKSMEYFELISQCDSPQKAKDLGCQRKNRFANKWLINKNKPHLGLVNDAIDKYKDVIISQDWESVKDDVMYKGLKYKFRNENLRTLLISTHPHKIVEDSPKDYYWGIGKDKTGKNMLGELLMELRDVLIEG